MNAKTVFWKESSPRIIDILKFSSGMLVEVYSEKRVIVYPSLPEGFLINDYDNKIGKEINEKLPVEFWETANTSSEELERHGERKEWEVKLRRGWFRDYLEVYSPKRFELENIIMFRCVPNNRP
jgi:hypothetical protein